jgi:hypothetical protein
MSYRRGSFIRHGGRIRPAALQDLAGDLFALAEPAVAASRSF